MMRGHEKVEKMLVMVRELEGSTRYAVGIVCLPLSG